MSAGNARAAKPRPAGPEGLRRVVKPARVRPLGPVGIDDLRSRVARLSERVWVQEDVAKENDYFCFHHTRHIVFRFIAGNRDPRRFYFLPIWAVWQPLLLPVLARAAAPYRFTDPVFPKVMLARLAAGHRIDTHRDGEGSNPYVHKIHVPLETNPRAVLTVDGDDFHLEGGHASEVNNLALHGAFNGGETDRVHLIFEVFEGARTA